MIFHNSREINGCTIEVILISGWSEEHLQEAIAQIKSEIPLLADLEHKNDEKEFLVAHTRDKKGFKTCLFANYDNFNYCTRVEAADIITEENFKDTVGSDKKMRREFLVGVYAIINESYLTVVEGIIMKSKPDGESKGS